MSGHSKWSTIKHKKGLLDQKRGKVFSKLSKIITVAAKEKGGDPDMNPRLRTAIDKAKAANMPQDNIEKAVKKGTGELEGVKFEESTYEAYGPGGIAIIIECITDNKNRTVSEIKHIVAERNGKMADSGSVLYMFDKIGEIIIHKPENQEEIELIAIDAGAEDIENRDEDLIIKTKPENLYNIKSELEKNNIEIESAEIGWKEKNPTEVTDEKIKQSIEKLFEELDDHDDVQAVYSNLKLIT